jgi:hypothetical protein
MRMHVALLMLSLLTISACSGSHYVVSPAVYSELNSMNGNKVTEVADVYIVPTTGENYTSGGTDYIFAGVGAGADDKKQLRKNLQCAAGHHAYENGYEAYRQELLEESYSRHLKLVYIVSMFNEPLPQDTKSYNHLLKQCNT